MWFVCLFVYLFVHDCDVTSATGVQVRLQALAPHLASQAGVSAST